jgi:hypothetical protein
MLLRSFGGMRVGTTRLRGWVEEGEENKWSQSADGLELGGPSC